MKLIQGWVSDDGKVFDSEQECLAHEANLKLWDKFTSCGCYYYSRWEGDQEELVAFLKDNKKLILDLLGEK